MITMVHSYLESEAHEHESMYDRCFECADGEMITASRVAHDTKVVVVRVCDTCFDTTEDVFERPEAECPDKPDYFWCRPLPEGDLEPSA